MEGEKEVKKITFPKAGAPGSPCFHPGVLGGLRTINLALSPDPTGESLPCVSQIGYLLFFFFLKPVAFFFKKPDPFVICLFCPASLDFGVLRSGAVS